MTADAEPVALTIAAVSKRFGATVALDGVSLEVFTGECLALVGESGCGKTTLLRCVNRLVEPDAGSITLRGRDVRAGDATELRRSLGYVPQDGGLMPHWRVLRNVALVPWLSGMPDADSRAREALGIVGFDAAGVGASVASRWPHELSGGQRQRVAMARALAAGQTFLLLDEPFGALDAITRSDLQRAFRQLRTHSRVTAILVTHDLREAAFLSDRIAVMRAGRIEQVASVAKLRSSPATPYVRQLLAHAELEMSS